MLYCVSEVMSSRELNNIKWILIETVPNLGCNYKQLSTRVDEKMTMCDGCPTFPIW